MPFLPVMGQLTLYRTLLGHSLLILYATLRKNFAFPLKVFLKNADM